MIKVQKRENNKKAENYRKEGYIPGVIYGPEIESQPVFISKKEFLSNLNRIHTRFEFEYEGKKLIGIIQDIQKDPITLEPIHFDIYVPPMYQKVTTAIPIVIKGEEEIVRKGWALNKLLEELEVEGYLGTLPEKIEIDVSNMNLGESIYVKDLNIEGQGDFEILTHKETPIVTIIEIKEETEEGEA